MPRSGGMVSSGLGSCDGATHGGKPRWGGHALVVRVLWCVGNAWRLRAPVRVLWVASVLYAGMHRALV